MPKLTVALNGIPVGTLSKHKNGALTFVYDKGWLDRAGARAVSLSMPLRALPYQGDIVYNFFDNLLPDNEAIRTRIQARFQAATKQPFDLLAKIGGDCVGAIQLYPEGLIPPDVRHVQAIPLDEQQIGELLSGYQQAPLGMVDGVEDFRISLAGAQEKTALLWYQNRWQRPVGSTPTSHILKLPIGVVGPFNLDLTESSENEWLCLKLLEAFGIPVAKAEIQRFADLNVLVVERFDRRWSKDGSWLMRLPQEDMCQALGIAPALKYEVDGGPGIKHIMQLLLGSQQAGEDRDRFFKVQILFWAMAAIDGHAKNFSLFLEPGSAYRMTPIYDVLSAYPMMGARGLPRQRVKMAMAVTGKNRHFHWDKIQARHFVSTAQHVGYVADRAHALMAEIKQQSDKVLMQVADALPANFPPHISGPILEGVRQQVAKLPG